MTFLFTHMIPTSQFLPAYFFTFIHFNHTIHNILILSTITFYHMFFLTGLTLIIMTISFTTMFSTGQGFLTFFTTLEDQSGLGTTGCTGCFTTMTGYCKTLVLAWFAFAFVTDLWARMLTIYSTFSVADLATRMCW